MPRNLHNDPFFTSTNPNCQYTNQTLRLDYAAVESNGSSCLGILRRYPSTAGPDPHVAGPKAHARCGAPSPLCQSLPSNFLPSLPFSDPHSHSPLTLCQNFHFFSSSNFLFSLLLPLFPVPKCTTRGSCGAPRGAGP